MQAVAELICIWGMAAVVLLAPTGMVIMWALCRSPSWNPPNIETPKAAEAVHDAPNASTAKAA